MKNTENSDIKSKKIKKDSETDFSEHYEDRCVCCAKKLAYTAMYIDGGGYVCPVCYNRISAYYEG